MKPAALKGQLFCPFCKGVSFAEQYYYKCNKCSEYFFVARASDIRNCVEDGQRADGDKAALLNVSLTVRVPTARLTVVSKDIPLPTSGRGRMQDM